MVLAFSPGEYFEKEGMPSTFIADSVKERQKFSVFITSARKERAAWQPIYDALSPAGHVATDKSWFLPLTEGRHGSSALWKKYSDSETYWAEVEKVLRRLL